MPLSAHLQERLKEFAEVQARPITDAALIERMRTEATKWINAVHMQTRRIEHPLANPDDPGGEAWRQEIDLHFLLVALTRLRRAVGLVTRVQAVQKTLLERLVEFDDNLPALTTLRNAAEHFDDYTTEKGRNKAVKRYQLQTWAFDKDEAGGIVWVWLGARFSVSGAQATAKELYDGFMEETAAVLRLP